MSHCFIVRRRKRYFKISVFDLAGSETIYGCQEILESWGGDSVKTIEEKIHPSFSEFPHPLNKLADLNALY